jgi:hypothetical protein
VTTGVVAALLFTVVTVAPLFVTVPGEIVAGVIVAGLLCCEGAVGLAAEFNGAPTAMLQL